MSETNLPNSHQNKLFEIAITVLNEKRDAAAIKLLEALRDGYIGDGLEGIDEVMNEIRKDYIGGKREIRKN